MGFNSGLKRLNCGFFIADLSSSLATKKIMAYAGFKCDKAVVTGKHEGAPCI
jgi:hypothetical protein